MKKFKFQLQRENWSQIKSNHKNANKGFKYNRKD